MSNPESNELPVLDLSIPPCRFLRSKGMYVYGDGHDDPYGDPESSIYWCLKTMKSFGADDQQANARDCRDGGRSCFESI